MTLQQHPIQSSFFGLLVWETAIGPRVKCAASWTYMMRGSPRSSVKHGMIDKCVLVCLMGESRQCVASIFGLTALATLKALKCGRNIARQPLYEGHGHAIAGLLVQVVMG